MTSCLDDNAITAFVAGHGDAAARAAVHAHVDQCAECRLALAEAAREEGDVPVPSASLIDGRFELLGPPVSGGMGEVAPALDRATGDQVALKLMSGHSEPEIERFRREAAALAKLSHAAIVRYVAHGSGADGRPYLAMEWVDGTPLRERLTRGPLSIAQAVRLGLGLAEGLAAAHDAGIVHRDIKPGNIVLLGSDPARPKIIDFGVARTDEDLDTLTAPGASLGTPAYMAPEQARDAALVDARADLFSLGCVLYRSISGAHPFSGTNAFAALVKMLLEPPTPIERLRPDTPPALATLIMDLLHKSPEDRPASARVVRDRLERILAGRLEPPQAEAQPVRVPSSPPLSAIEQRVLCVLLVRLEGRMGMLKYAQLLSTVEASGARADLLRGGECVVSFSTRVPPKDQALRAAKLALALRDSEPGARISIALGSGSVGGVTDGAVIDRAAAQLRNARPGEVLIDSGAAATIDAQFTLVRGTRGTLLSAARTSDDANIEPAVPMLGREPELSHLVSAARVAFEEEESRAVLIVGPTGSGKSRLCQALLKELRVAHGATVLVGEGDPGRVGSSYSLVADLLQRAAATRPERPIATEGVRALLAEHLSDPRAVDLLARRAEVLEPGSSDERPTVPRGGFEGHQLAWEDFVAAACQRAPVVIVLEELDWVDATSLRLMQAMMRNLARARLLLIGLLRDDSPSGPQAMAPPIRSELTLFPAAARIHLAPLSRRTCERLAELHSGGALDAATLARVAERSEGNPFFLLELVRSVGEANADFPDTVLGAVQARLARLSPEATRVLRAGSIFGRVFWLGGVASLLGASAVGERELDELVQAGWVTARSVSSISHEREYGFSSDIALSAVRATVAPEDRESAHLGAGRWLEAHRGDPAQMADHFERGGDPARARLSHLAAAKRALAAGDHGAVNRHVDGGLVLSHSAAERVRLLLVRAESLLLGDQSLARSTCEEVLALAAPEGSDYITALGFAASAAAGVGDVEAVADAARKLIARWATRAPGAVAAGAAIRVALNLFFTGQLELYQAVMRLLASAESEIAEAPAVLTRWDWLRTHERLEEEPQEFLAAMERAAARFERVGEVPGLINARVSGAFARILLGDFELARDALVDAVSTADRIGQDHLAATARHNLGLALFRLGELDAARDAEQQALDTFISLRETRMVGASRAYLAAIERERGQLDLALALAQQAVIDLERSPLRKPLAWVELSAVSLRLGRTDAALRAAREALHIARRAHGRQTFDLAAAACLVQALLAARRPARARCIARLAVVRLEQRAARLHEEGARRRYRERVPDHSLLLAAAGGGGVEVL